MYSPYPGYTKFTCIFHDLYNVNKNNVFILKSQWKMEFAIM